MGRKTGSRNVRSRLKTLVRKIPTGFVTKNTISRKNRIWNQPFAVISEFLRAQECVNKVNRGQHTHREHNHGFQAHLSFSSLHAIAEVYVTDGQDEECDRYCHPKKVLHI